MKAFIANYSARCTDSTTDPDRPRPGPSARPSFSGHRRRCRAAKTVPREVRTTGCRGGDCAAGLVADASRQSVSFATQLTDGLIQFSVRRARRIAFYDADAGRRSPSIIAPNERHLPFKLQSAYAAHVKTIHLRKPQK